MKTILCYGDSNTWGYDPAHGGRYPWEVRWTGVLQHLLGEGWRVLEEGLNGRTAAYPEPGRPYRSGVDYLRPCLLSHLPLDGLVVMLGTNDAKYPFALSPARIAGDMDRLLRLAGAVLEEQGATARMLLVAPAPVRAGGPFDYDESSVERIRALPALYRALAQKHGCAFLDAAGPVPEAGCDGVHFTPENHRALAGAVAAWAAGL